MSELRMLTEFLRLPEGDEFAYEEEELSLVEEPLDLFKSLASIFKKKVTDAAPKGSPAPDGKGSIPATSYAQDAKKFKPKSKPKGKWISSGCVVFDDIKMQKLYVIRQKNWGTYAFPKGRVDEGESIKKAAVREVGEETGLKVALLPSGYLGKGVGSYSITHFFAAVKTGGSAGQHDHEVEAVKLVSFTEAFRLFRKSGGTAGKRDMMILRKAWEYANKYRKGMVPEWPGSK